MEKNESTKNAAKFQEISNIQENLLRAYSKSRNNQSEKE
jgi:hypothetical protein